ncbi:MAG TPA: MerR family transcriptional regulator [Actinomycetota bacterium]|nr:MerR family transcriptional regulator [Actinomycetota bacterium]
MATTTENGYRAPEVVKLVGVTYRQLDYWARTELVKPSVRDASGSGTQRLYGFQDLVLLRSIKNLLETGVTLQKIRKAVDYLREHLGEAPQEMTLMSDGRNIYAAKSRDEIIDLMQQGQGTMFTLQVDRVWTDLEKTLGRKTGS